MSVLSLGYLRLRSPDLDEWDRFATAVLGLSATTGPEDGTRYFRWDHLPHRLAIAAGDEPDVTAVGWEVVDDRDLAAVAGAVAAAGIEVAAGAPEEAAARGVSGLVSFRDPAGVPVELFHGPVLTHEPVLTPLVSGFVTGDMGFGHVVTSVPDLDESIAFYRDVLGFHLRNTWYLDPMSMAFLGCNPRHHSLAFGAGVPGPGLLRHFMVEVATIDDVGRAQDRCVDAGVEVVMGLGRHTNDEMISFYCRTPDGFMVELGWGGIRIEDPSTAPTYQITRPSSWGHRPIPTDRGAG